MQGLDRISQDNTSSTIHLSALNVAIALSFLGMMWSVASYLLFTEWQCFDDRSLWSTQLLPFLKNRVLPLILRCIEACCPRVRKLNLTRLKSADDAECNSQYSVYGTEEYQSITKDDDSEDLSGNFEESTPLLGSSAIIVLFTLVQLIARPFITTVNLVYLVLNGKDYDGIGEDGGSVLNTAIYNSILYETILLIVGPAMYAIYWTFWRQCQGNNKCRKYLEFLRFCDLEIAVLMAPYSNVHLYALGGWWYLVLIVRLVFYAITFASAVIAGMRFICACYCIVFCTCGCDNDVLEIRNAKHLVGEIGFKLIPIFFKINTCSSALATFLKFAHYGSPRFRQTFLAFSVIRGLTSMCSLGFSGAMLRWSVLKREHKWDDKSWLTKVLRFMDTYRPHVHMSFFFDMLCYFGLLVLNLILLEFISERDFYCSQDCGLD